MSKVMKIILYFAFLIILRANLSSQLSLDSYCKVDKDSTPCYYKCERAAECGDTKFGFRVLTEEERTYVLHHHNLLRNEAAGGKFSNEFLPTMANMKVLSYDKENEFIAGCFIKQCLVGELERVRQTATGQVLGQNSYTITTKAALPLDTRFLKRMMETWVNKQLIFLNSTNSATFSTDFRLVKKARDLTQVLWANSLLVGCAMMHNFKFGKNKYNYDALCNYRPSGNVEMKSMYKEGEAASACTETSPEYPNLCGVIRPISDDKYVPPIKLSKYEDIKSSFAPILTLLSLLFSYIVYFY